MKSIVPAIVVLALMSTGFTLAQTGNRKAPKKTTTEQKKISPDSSSPGTPVITQNISAGHDTTKPAPATPPPPAPAASAAVIDPTSVPRTNFVSANVIRFVTFYNLSYFRTLNSRWMAGGGIQMPSFRHYSGVGLFVEGRWFPGERAPYNLYFAPNASYNIMQFYSTKINVASIGGVAGWQFFPIADFSFSAGVGMDIFIGGQNVTDPTGKPGGNYTGFTPMIRAEAAYTWN